ncbi:ferric-rhodotorulic acid/ferric-coprogen receptor FhuE [Biostraticola tofi]|uniref:Outer membrane receptor for ferric coprogen and ferric-rhodotorulic acid n=1 Tax=Biostraticola tofi TaxID=466109 RepID=A0A4R3Z1U1_9GAMM|nr:ferric-rhodotorulic acid/ferric-coprogen receptor FhuE [Biostraticola tofi]TCV98965.1 outer membrane receptor for ferric coprogen and ferric-rhodotorulic acid [Biostraticola tofi]
MKGLIYPLAGGMILCLNPVMVYADEPGKAAEEKSEETLEVIASPFPADGSTEYTGSYTTGSTTSSTGLPLSIRETPQSVSVMTSQRIKDENMRSLVDVMASTPGISAYNYDVERYSFSSRGFSITNYQYDGVPTSFNTGYDAGESAIDPIIYDRIDVVRGATGLLTGAGNPSASINLIRKHANSREFMADITASAGSWDAYRTTADLSAPLSDSGDVRGRIVTAWEDSKSFLDGYGKKKKIFYGVIDADLTDDTSLSLGANYQDNDPEGSSWGGFPLWYADGGRTDWRRSLNIGADWTSWASTTQGAFATLKHHFNNDWNLQISGAHSRHEIDAKLLFMSGWPDRVSGQGMSASPSWYFGDRKQNSLDAKASGPFSLLGREHEAVVGASTKKQKSAIDYRGSASTIPVGNFLKWNGAYPEPDWTDASPSSRQTERQDGVYSAVRLSLAEPLTLIIGGRYSEWKTRDIKSDGGSDNINKSAFTPYTGLLYDFAENYTAYISYTSIFNPQSSQDKNGDWLEPLDGQAWESGIKGEFFGGRLNASAAVYQIEQDNLAQIDTNHRVPGTTNQAYYAAQGTRSRGFELETSGQIAPGWNIAASWTHWTGEDNQGKPISTNQPRTLIKGFTTWQLPGRWNSLTLGGGVNWQSEVYTLATGPNGNERVSQGSYATTNLMARYQFTKNLSAQLNVNNLFDYKYYNQIGFYSQGAWGAGRSVVLTGQYLY